MNRDEEIASTFESHLWGAFDEMNDIYDELQYSTIGDAIGYKYGTEVREAYKQYVLVELGEHWQ